MPTTTTGATRRIRLAFAAGAATAVVLTAAAGGQASAPPTAPPPPETAATPDAAPTTEPTETATPPTQATPTTTDTEPATTVDAPTETGIPATEPQETEPATDSTAPASEPPTDSTTPDSSPPPSSDPADSAPPTSEPPPDSEPADCPTLADEAPADSSPVAVTTQPPADAAVADAAQPFEPCVPAIECPTPSYASGTGSSDGSGGGTLAILPGRTPAAPPPSRDELVAHALGETLTGMNYHDRSLGSGAYLITDDAWDRYGGYPSAAAAPPHVQDQQATQLVAETRQQQDHTSDDTAIAAAWHAAVTTTDLFRNEFIAQFEANLAAIDTAEAAVEAAPPRLQPGEITFPVLGPVQYGDTFGAPRGGVPDDEQPRCHEGTDIFGALGQPIVAPVTGVVTTGAGTPALSGIGISVTAGGYHYNLFHLTAIAPGIHTGARVQAGQIIGYMGTTGNAGVPHLHFEIRDNAGSATPSFAALDAAAARQAGQLGIGPWSTIVTEQATTHHVVATTTGRGRWIIDDAGRVTATGDAALITPTGQAGPTVAYGTDSAG